MRDHNDKIRSLVKVIKNDSVSTVCIASEFEDFIDGDIDDAFTYFAHKGMIQTHSEYDSIMGFLFKVSRTNPAWPTMQIKDIVGAVMKESGAKLNPNGILALVKQFVITE